MGAGLFVLDDLVSVKLEDLHVLKGLSVNDHSDKGNLLVKPRIACCARVDMKQIQLFVVYYLQYMRMAAYVEVGFLGFENILHLRHVMARVTTNVGHVDVDIFDMEKQIFGILHAHNVVVDVAMYGTQWFEVGQSFCCFNVPNITRVPQLVNVLEEIEKLWHEGAMRVRQNADFQHVISS